MKRARKRPPGQGFQKAKDAAALAETQKQRGRGAVWVGFWVGLLAYLLLSIQQPDGWKIPIWILLGFLVVPGLIGLLIGRKLGEGPTPRMKFWAGFKGAAWPMALYTFANTFILMRNMQNPEGDRQRLIAVVLVTVVFALLVGGVAGLAGALTAKRAPKGEPA